MEYPDPVVVPAAAVVAFGDYVLIHAQDAQISPATTFTRVDYRFKDISPIEVDSEYVGASTIGVPLDHGSRFRLHAAVPNPTRGTVSVGLDLAVSSQVTAQIMSIDGRVVRRLASGEWFGPGTRTLRWDGLSESKTPLSSAVYFLVVRAGGVTKARRLVLSR